MSGRHNLMNALAAAAVATCFEIAADANCRSLEYGDAAEDARRGARLRRRIYGCGRFLQLESTFVDEHGADDCRGAETRRSDEL